MDAITITRRKAHAAILDAFERAGIPRDYVVLPHPDDYEQLLVLGEREVRWCDERQSRRRAAVCFDSSLTGAVVGDSIHRAVDSEAFYAEDCGIEHPYSFDLPFDLTETEQTHGQAWRELPMVPLRKRRRVFKAKVTGSL